MYIVFYTNNHLATSQPFSNRLVTSQPFPTRTRQHGPVNDYQLLAHLIRYFCIDECLPDIHLTFIHHMTKESTDDDGAEEIRVVSHGDEHELSIKEKYQFHPFLRTAMPILVVTLTQKEMATEMA